MRCGKKQCGQTGVEWGGTEQGGAGMLCAAQPSEVVPPLLLAGPDAPAVC